VLQGPQVLASLNAYLAVKLGCTCTCMHVCFVQC
jgi:hypothetical protein